MLADLNDNAGRKVGEREAVFTLSVLVGAIPMARAVDDPDLSRQILTAAAAALKERVPTGPDRGHARIAHKQGARPS